MVVRAFIFATRDALEAPKIELSGKALMLHSSKVSMENISGETLLVMDLYGSTVWLTVQERQRRAIIRCVRSER